MNMDSFNKAAPQFTYNPNPDSESGFSAILDIHVHHARNIHNICIYENQDVYAKFSLTYNPDDTLSTTIIIGGGKNPDFNEDLIMQINQADAVLKCEIWMSSKVKTFMDDQLLGFTLVPIYSVFGKGKVTQDFSLSSTDLFHSPAGTIKLSLSLNAKTIPFTHSSIPDSSSSCELLLDKKIQEEKFSNIEFPDMNVVTENQQMVSEYFAKNGAVLRPWLHLGAAPIIPNEDYEMAANSSDEYRAESISPDGSSIQTSGFHSSSMTSLGDDRNSADSKEKIKSLIFTDNNSLIIAETLTSKEKSECRDDHEKQAIIKVEESKHLLRNNVKIEAEESAMQKQIVDMYMRSMHQFTESLAKMKLPMDLDKVSGGNAGDLMQSSDEKIEIENKNKNKKDNSRVFYGSRAFF